MDPNAPLTAQSIRAVQFREKLRGYHPEDVDAFVSAVARTVDDLEQRLKIAESGLNELASRSSATNEAEESLRRTLVLAQRTADLAIQEARDEADRMRSEAAEQRAAAEAELDELRERLHREAEEAGRSERERLAAERAGLEADVAALEAHLDRERERLRIYFTDQLRRVDAGEPGLAPSPEMTGPASPETAADAGSEDGESSTTAPENDGVGAEAMPGPGGDDTAADGTRAEEDDPFLAELRRAVTDDQPLGPRDHVPGAPAEDDDDDDGFDLFAKGDDETGRFGSRLRRRR